MKLETIRLDDIREHPDNPRTITPEAAAGLRNSVETFGLVEPLVWNERTRRLVGGHQRLAALRDMGETEAPAVIVDLSEGQERALLIALNNPATQGTFTDYLRPLLDEIRADTPDTFQAVRLDTILKQLAIEDDIDRLRREIEAEREHHASPTTPAEIAELVARMKMAICARLDRLASEAPDRLEAALAVVIPREGSGDCIILADPATRDAAAELRRYAEAGEPSPVEKLFEGLFPFTKGSDEDNA